MTDPTRSGTPAASSKNARPDRGAKRARPAPNKAASQSKPRPRQPAPRPEPALVRVIAVANQKGGVGKSTTAVSLGAALAELGHRVLVVDLDPQGNASTGLGIRHESREVTVYDVLAAEAPIQGAVVPTPIPGLFAVPSTIDLAGAEIELVSQFSREMRLRKALDPLRNGVGAGEGFGFILLDCPPSLGLLTVNALAAAEELIVPIQCEYYALEGLGQLLRNVRLVQQNVNPGLRLTGIVMTMFDPRTRLSEQVVAEVRRYFGDRVYRTIIPRTVRLSEAPGYGQPITVYDPSSRGAQSYRELAREVASRLPADEPMPVFEDMPRSVRARESAPMSAPRPLVREPELEGEQGPEPSARRAPRPLVPSSEEELQPLADEESVEPEAATAAPTEDSLELEAPRYERSMEVGRPDADNEAAREEPEPEDEQVALPRHGASEPDPLDEPLPRAAVEPDRDWEPVATPWEESEPQPAPEPADPTSFNPWGEPGEGDVGVEPEPVPRRWWRVFLRGGEG